MPFLSSDFGLPASNRSFNENIMSNSDDSGFGYLNINSSLYKTRISRKFGARVPFMKADPGLVTSFIPGTITGIMVKEGDRVAKGDNLMVLDAMKMQNNLKSGIDGIVKEILVAKGDRVAKGVILCKVVPA